MRPVAAVPAVEVVVDGEPLTPSAHAALASVRVARRLSVPAQCEVGFALGPGSPVGPDLAYALAIGSDLAVDVAGDHGRLFDGEITAQEWVHPADGSAELRVRAYDPLHRLRKHQQVIARTAITVAELADELAGDAGLATKAEEDGPRYPVLVQHRQTDLELLQEVAGHAGLWFVVADADLRLFTLEGFGDAIDLALHQTLLAARFDTTADPACRTVTAVGWDPVAAVALTAEVSEARVGRDVGADAAPDAVGADGERFLVDRPGPTTDHLAAAARAELDRRVAREVTFTGTAEGDARLQPGRPVSVSGARPDLAGTYVLTETVHTLDGAGYLVELSTAPPSPAAQPTGTAATLGIVISADDPDGLGRVRVRLPGYGDVETDWRELVVPGAGAGKGLVAIPDTDDRVLVLLPHGDPAAAVVLGGLYGDGAPFDPGLEGGSVKRWSLLTPGGQKVVLDDDQGRVVVANRDGSTVVLAPDSVTVHAAGDLVIQAPGKTMTLRANRIELQQATAEEPSP